MVEGLFPMDSLELAVLVLLAWLVSTSTMFSQTTSNSTTAVALGGISLTSTSSTETAAYSFEKVAVRRDRMNCRASRHIFCFIIYH